MSKGQGRGLGQHWRVFTIPGPEQKGEDAPGPEAAVSVGEGQDGAGLGPEQLGSELRSHNSLAPLSCALISCWHLPPDGLE